MVSFQLALIQLDLTPNYASFLFHFKFDCFYKIGVVCYVFGKFILAKKLANLSLSYVLNIFVLQFSCECS